MLVYGRNVAERIFKDEKLLKKVRKLEIEEKYYLKIKNLLREFPKSKTKLARKSEIDNLTKDKHQGIIIDMEDYQYTPLNKILNREDDKILLLDHILDPHNFGAIIRTCAAAGISSIIIPKDRSVKVTDTVIKTSVGTINYVKIIMVNNLVDAINKLKKIGYFIYSADMSGEDFEKVDYSGKRVLIIGNEGKGISPIIKNNCDFLVRIPLNKNVESLNASVAAGILIYKMRNNNDWYMW